MDRRRFLLLAPAAAGAAAATGALRVAGAEEPGDRRFVYAHRLLQLALAKSGQARPLQVVTGLKQRRQMRELEQGYLDVGLLASNLTDSHHDALAVEVPIRRGLLGLRLVVTRAELAGPLARCASLAELAKRCRFGHGAGWADLDTMRDAGLRVQAVTGYHRLFEAVRHGAVDALSRSVTEVWDELGDATLGNGLTVVPRIALFYPLDDFFWVNPRRPELAAAIAEGLQRARRDGSYQLLFKEFYRPALDRAQMPQRQVFAFTEAKVPSSTPARLFDVLSSLTEAS